MLLSGGWKGVAEFRVLFLVYFGSGVSAAAKTLNFNTEREQKKDLHDVGMEKIRKKIKD